uniref:Efflux transporter, RND family, MFP subunit n=1 Tax=Cyanothece sp. (strain PCC 7425 / ATCC 29141) TaxID=395961 RepID=B8HKM7_CYAP4
MNVEHPSTTSVRFSKPIVRTLALSILLLSGCARPTVEGQSSAAQNQDGIPVDVAIARLAQLESPRSYTGTTRPRREIALRSQIEAQLLNLSVDVGDRVRQGQILAQLDNALLRAEVIQAQSELAARRSEVVQAETQVNRSRTAVEQSRLALQQAQSDAQRLEQLLKEGATSQQLTEQAQTAAQTAQQVLQSTQAEVRTAQQAVQVAQKRVKAQAALVAQSQERLSYAIVTSPITGVVLQRVTEPGNLLRPGEEILQLGDLSQIKVVVTVSELELRNLRPGQAAQVRLDALGQTSFAGTISRISPAADPTARLVPIEIILNNPDARIGSGLLARVEFATAERPRVVIPQSALESEKPSPDQQNTLFIVTGQGDQARVQARSVQLGDHRNGQVEVLSGLRAGEQFVVRSGRPLKDGARVRFSILSEGV